MTEPRIRTRLTRNQDITFCIMSFERLDLLKKCLLSIREHCKLKHTILLLAVSGSPNEFKTLVGEIEPQNTEIITAPVWLTNGSGHNLVTEAVTSDFTMLMDDDAQLTNSTLPSAVDVLNEFDEIGAVSMPHYDELGHMISLGGRSLTISNGVIYRTLPELDSNAKWIEVEDLDESAMIYRTEMRRDFSFDGRYRHGFDDIDKSLSILMSGKWKQAIVPRGRVIHDKSGLGKTPRYERARFNGIEAYRSYQAFRRKWGLRFDMKTNLLSFLIYPTLTILRNQRAIGIVNNQVRRRAVRKLSRAQKRLSQNQ